VTHYDYPYYPPRGRVSSAPPLPPDVPVTWATVTDVATFLREPQTAAADDADMAAATAAANSWAYRRRAAAGYVDDPATPPGPDVVRGVVMYAAARYREGGATDGFASFAEFPPGYLPGGGTLGEVYRLLGVNRPVVA